MSKTINGSAFPSAAMDVRQVSTRRNPNSKTAVLSGVTNEWFSVFKRGSPLVPELSAGETATMGMLTANRKRVTKSTFTTNLEYELTRQDITAMLYFEEDEDFVRPTQYALNLTLSLLENANTELVARGILFPRGTSSTSDKGGIYVFWDVNSQSVQLEVPPCNGGVFYIHVTSPGKSLLNKNVSAKTLADALAVANPPGRRRLGTTNATASSAAR